ncbi:MAG: hypothetical protein RTU30_05290 [Candidatus Thorarchaeota archaeon]
MRETTSALDLAIADTDGIKPATKATVFKNRIYFKGSDLDIGDAASFAQTPGIKDEPLSQDMCFSNDQGVMLTVYSYTSGSAIEGTIHAQMEGYSEVELSFSGSSLYSYADCRPAIITSGSDGYIYYYDPINQEVRRATVDTSGSGFTVSAVDTVKATTYKTSVHATAVDELALLWIYEGGVSVSIMIYDGGWNEDEWDNRFEFPTHVFTELEDAVGLNFSGAVKLNDDYYVYYTQIDGSVIAVSLLPDGVWTDSWSALPSDLSTFNISKAIISPNGYVHLVGQFQRIDEGSDVNDPVQYDGSWASSVVMGLDLWSREGRVFSMDRFTLFCADDTDEGSDLCGYRYMIAFDDVNNITYFSDANRYYSDDSYWSTNGEYALSLVIDDEDITSLSGDASTAWTLTVSNGDEVYTSGSNADILIPGNIIDLDVGAMSGSEALLSDFDLCIIAAVDFDTADARRKLSISLVSMTLWKSSVMTHPFYMEIESKQSVYDPIDDFSNLYLVGTGNIPQTFWIDMWNNDTFKPQNHALSTTTVHETDELSTLGLAANPVVSTLPMTIKLFGWSRSGPPTVSQPGAGFPNGDDSDGRNDDFTATLVVKHVDDDDETTIVLDNVTSAAGNPPQTWGVSGSGSYPVEVSASGSDGLVVGDEVVRVGFRVTSTSDDETVYVCERIEIPELTMYLRGESGDDWEDFDQEVDLEDDGYFTAEFTDKITDGGNTSTLSLLSPIAYQFGYPDVGTSWGTGYALKLHCISNPQGSGRFKIYYRIYRPNNYPPNQQYQEWNNACTGFTPLNCPHWGTLSGNQSTGGTEGWYYFTRTMGQNFNPTPGSEGYLAPTFSGAGAGSTFIAGTRFEILQMWFDNVEIDLNPTEVVTGKRLLRFGTPVVHFSRKPFRAFNFQTASKFYVSGLGGWAGVVGLASDADNYIVARVSEDELELVKVRAGIETVLTSTPVDSVKYKSIMMEHKDGVFKVWVRSEATQNPSWDIVPDITYEWTESDGQLSMSNDIMHLGIYAYKHTYSFRVVGYDSGYSTEVGRLAGDNEFDSFPSSGQISIGGYEYTYTGKITSGSDPIGPFQARNTHPGYDYTSADGQKYTGNAVEFTRFEWKDNTVYHSEFDDLIMAASNGHAWVINDADFKPWIRTAGQMIWLKNRMRAFGGDVDGNFVGFKEKVYITEGLSGVTLDEDQEDLKHPEGTFAWLSSDCEVIFLDFYASNGLEDASVEDILELVCQLAGGEAIFPGDITSGSELLTGSEWTVE